ncbi:MAG TPA: protein-L-isoaspartate O-methyltransferase [Caulobacteraceae bacterium]|nr:protein-L-isoaspartate O-methyltransferase [Caulobacteraceae bacterium]
MDFQTARRHMLDSQVRTNDVTDVDIQQAMLSVPRERFCAPARAFAAYAEVEPEICPGRWLMKARDVSKLLQAAKPRAGERALALAAPYAAALLARMGLDVVAQEADGRAAAVLEGGLAEAGVPLKSGELTHPVGQDYDLIVCEGAVAEVPQSWVDALKPGGRLAVVERDGPVGKARLYVRTASGASSREVFDATPPMLPGFERVPTFQF